MTRAEMRELLRLQVFDESSTLLSDAQANILLNAAQQHIGNMVTAQDENLLIAVEEITVNNTTSSLYVFRFLDRPVRRIIHAHRGPQGLSGDDDPTLKIVSFDSAKQEIGVYGSDGLKDKPPIFVFNQQVGFVQPADEIIVRIYYVAGLADMDTDSSVSTLPVEFHSLVPTWAAIMAMAGENADSTQTQAVFATLTQAAGLAVQGRTDAPE